MKFLLAVALFGAFAAQVAFAEEVFEDQGLVDESQGRFLYFNTSSTATSLTLLGALILLGVIGYLIYAGGLLGSQQQSGGYNRNGYEQYYEDPANQQYAQYRSSDAAPEFNAMKIIEWMAVFREMYDSFDPNDLECQKRLICDVVKNEAYYGAGAAKLKSGFRAAKFLEYVSLPDDIRELVDEYLDANARAEQDKDCSEYFQCPFSINDSAKRNLNQL